jgi:DNA-binding winged helix-turn-helix (wHTH) protein
MTERLEGTTLAAPQPRDDGAWRTRDGQYSQETRLRYVFGDYTLDAARYELRRAGVLIPVAPRAFDLLAYLVQHAGQTVSKEELFAQLWAAQFVTDSALTYCMTEVRKALGDTGRGQRYIRTVYGRGYRFIVPVAVQQEVAIPAQCPETPGLPRLTAGSGLDQADTGVSHSPLMPTPPAALSLTPGATSPPTVDAPTLPTTEGMACRWMSRWPCRWGFCSHHCRHTTRRADCRPNATYCK